MASLFGNTVPKAGEKGKSKGGDDDGVKVCAFFKQGLCHKVILFIKL